MTAFTYGHNDAGVSNVVPRPSRRQTVTASEASPACAQCGVVSTYAKYVGRVGALAVALGVFGAVATSPGVAWADSTDSSPSPTSSDSSGSTGSTNSASSDNDSDAGTSGDPGGAGPNTSDDVDDVGTDDVDGATGADTDANETDTDAGADEADDAEDEVVDEDPKETTETPDPEPVGEQPGTDADEDLPAESQDSSDDASRPPPATPDATDLSDHTVSDTSIENAEGQSAERVLPTNLAEAPADGATTATLALQSDEPAAAVAAQTTDNPLILWGKQIGTALNLPTPDQVVQQIKTTVITCVCGVINTMQNLLAGVITPATSPGPASPAQNTIIWSVLAWTRRQVDYAVAAFNRSPLGQLVHQVGVAVTDWAVDIGNSPAGRQFSSMVAQFVEECGGSTELPAEFDRTVLVSGLNEPTDFEFVMAQDDPDHIHQILFTEKSGAIKAYDVDTGTLTTLAQVNVVTADGERGLIGIEVDPNFWDSTKAGYQTVYVAYTNAQNFDQLSSFVMSGNTLTDETELLRSTEQANEFHHGGELEFDPTGQYLYWGVGNNTTPSENSQNLTNIHGKILRLNRDGTAADGNPFIESDNEITQRIYAYGLRNPFRFTFDAQTGALLAGDVGEASWEELNLVQPGANYGWPDAEGPLPGSGFVDPLYAYRHTAPTNAGSITSVMVYDDGSVPAGQKKVLIADYSLGWIKELTFDDQYSSLISERTLDSGAGAVVKLTQAPNGDIYQLNIYPGTLSVIAPSAGNRSPSAVIEASATSGEGSSLVVDFSAAGSGDPDGDALTYHWNFGNGQTSTEANPTVTFTNAGSGFTSYNVTLTVSDQDKTATATQRIVVGSTPPVADFETNSGDYNYNAGDTIDFTATGSDDQDGTLLPDSAFSWTVEFHHADHKHPFVNNVVGPELSITVPTDYDQLANTYYKVILTVTDSSGLTTTVEKDVRPNLVTLTFGANNPNARYTLDGIPRTGTYSELAVVGVHRTIGAISPQTVGGQQLAFDSWSDGGTQTHVIVTPGANTSYTVNYAAVASSIAV